ncbi:hypothetical protein STSP_49050 [Streptomyces jeddahensis]|uniref:Uncharacterized protein n=1 Tax=Streptomyces jeddahensis TaxID=1716141 RepID=A0A177HLW2_9ACTN|nr:hypothetical protein STSP_49050 [Streptomyces jeddahensis]
METGVTRPSKAICKAFSGAVQRMVQPRLPFASRVEVHRRHVDALERHGLVRKAASGADGFADTGVDAIAYALQITLRISTSKERKGTNSAHRRCRRA